MITIVNLGNKKKKNIQKADKNIQTDLNSDGEEILPPNDHEVNEENQEGDKEKPEFQEVLDKLLDLSFDANLLDDPPMSCPASLTE